MKRNAKFRRALFIIIAVNMIWSLAIKSFAANKPPPENNDTGQCADEKDSESKNPNKEFDKLTCSFSLIGLFLEIFCKNAFQELFNLLKRCTTKLIKVIKKKAKKKTIPKYRKHKHKKQ